MSKLINDIMAEGIIKALFEQCQNRLWSASRLLEDAREDRFRRFRQKMDEAKKAIEEAEELYLEWLQRSNVK